VLGNCKSQDENCKFEKEAEDNYSAQPVTSEQFEICIFQFAIFNVQPKTEEIVELIL